MTIPNAAKTLIDISIILGSVSGYIYQYWLIRKNQSVGTFSIDICGILLFSNILRINFYYFQQYQYALLLQSILMVTVQLFLLQLCKSYPTSNEQQIDQSNKVQRFWRWGNFNQYMTYIIGFTLIMAILTFMMLNEDKSGLYGQMIGLIALGSESILILPQIIRNYKEKKVKGVSHLLLSFNLFGDLFKLTYFIIQDQPFQFKLCGVVQVILDTFVIAQILYYRKNGNQPSELQEKQVKNIQDVQTNASSENGQKVYPTREIPQQQPDIPVDTNDHIGLQQQS